PPPRRCRHWHLTRDPDIYCVLRGGVTNPTTNPNRDRGFRSVLRSGANLASGKDPICPDAARGDSIAPATHTSACSGRAPLLASPSMPHVLRNYGETALRAPPERGGGAERMEGGR